MRRTGCLDHLSRRFRPENRKRTIATSDISTCLFVGGTPGNIHGIPCAVAACLDQYGGTRRWKSHSRKHSSIGQLHGRSNELGSTVLLEIVQRCLHTSASEWIFLQEDWS